MGIGAGRRRGGLATAPVSRKVVLEGGAPGGRRRMGNLVLRFFDVWEKGAVADGKTLDAVVVILGGVTFGRFAATTNCHVRTNMSSDRAKTGSAAGWGGYGTTTVRVRCESGAESDATQEHNILCFRVFTDGLGAGLPG